MPPGLLVFSGIVYFMILCEFVLFVARLKALRSWAGMGLLLVALFAVAGVVSANLWLLWALGISLLLFAPLLRLLLLIKTNNNAKGWLLWYGIALMMFSLPAAMVIVGGGYMLLSHAGHWILR
jgi:hypothetical protein